MMAWQQSAASGRRRKGMVETRSPVNSLLTHS
jgi:hypothetical protein